MTYEEFSSKIEKAIKDAGGSSTWTEIRTAAKLPQKFPNNQWVHRMEQGIGLQRERDKHGIIHWKISYTQVDATTKPTESSKRSSKETGRKQGPLE